VFSTPIVADEDDIVRSTIKEDRGDYFVSYRPADRHLPFANISVTFPVLDPELSQVRQAMLHEMRHWLSRFDIPVMITSFDIEDSIITVHDESDTCHLMAFIEPSTGATTQRWGLFRNDEIPDELCQPAHRTRMYAGVPTQSRRQVRKKAERQARMTGRVLRPLLLTMVGFPVAIELVALGVNWLGHVLAALSIGTGIWKLALALRWRKPTKREADNTAMEGKMKHCLHHCERNPDAFARLKAENFRHDIMEATRKEAAEIRNCSGTKPLAISNNEVS
jgi:hypothetical protein